MSDKQAPCGHPGEAIIGGYVRCKDGCAKDPRNGVGAVPVKRGQPGHVDFCACRPCTVRRRGREVVLRTKKGAEIRIPWNGVQDKFQWAVTVKGHYRHWAIVDEDGDTLEDGTLFDRDEWEVGELIDFEFFVPTSKFEAKRSARWNKGPSWRQLAKPMNFGSPQPRHLDLAEVARSVPGVTAVKLRTNGDHPGVLA